MTAAVHLGVILTNYPPHVGGVEKHAEALARGLTGRGHRVTAVCLGERASVEDRDGVAVHTLRRRVDLGGVLALPEPGAWQSVRGHLAAAGLTHVAVHTRFFPMTWLGVRLARSLGVPSVLTEHGGGPISTASSVVNSGGRAVDATAGRWALQRAGTVLAVSAAAANFVRSLARRDAAVLGNGCDATFWSGSGVPVPRRHVVFAGRLVPEKGWREALHCLADLEPDVTATFAGDGPDRLALHRAVDDLGLRGRVELPGQLDALALRAAYAGSVYVNASTAAEGFQTTLLEAGLAGARVATYDVGGAAEVVGSGGAVGRIVAVGDTPRLRAAVRSLLAAAGPGRPELLAAYDWPAVTDRYLAALEVSAR